MNTPRETIYQAIFTQLQEAVVTPLGFKTSSRRIKAWSEVDPSLQPALYQTQVKENSTVQGRGLPPRWDLLLDITLYANTGKDLNTIPSTVLNNAIDIICNLFPGVSTTNFTPGPKGPAYAQQNANYQTLGLPGVVLITVEGQIDFFEGDLNGQAVAVIPMHIIAV